MQNHRRRYPFALLDVFTDVPLAGNAVAVVHDADGIDDETMLAFARETRLSETCFVQSPTAGGADYRNRIWTVAREIPFAGHPSLGVAVAVARRRGEREIRFVQQTEAGMQPLDVAMSSSSGGHASVLAEPVVFGAEVDPAEVMAAVGLAPDDADPDRPPRFATVGLDTLIAPIARADALSRAVPDYDRIDALSDLEDFNLYLVALDREAESGRARMFTRWTPGGEDPATGSAVAPLCAYLAERERWTRIEVTQGVEMGRPSRLVAELEGDRVRVGGHVVIVIEGEVVL
jgi:trans-2,3-dihydro-3-hydroxyanthranilate isomerase